MDPVATILSVLERTRTVAEARADLAHWYRRKGWHPTLANVEAEATRRGLTLPRNWRSTARLLGAL